MRRLLAFAWAAAPLAALAGAFGVSPIRVDLDPGARSGLITVSNDDERRQSFQLKLFEWTQSATGEDRLAESEDLIYFPQIFAVEPKQKRIVRVGVKAPPAGAEKAYRLFIEEMPDPSQAPSAGAQVAVRLRFGVPIFVSSGKGEAAAEVDAVSASKGELRVAIRNSGTRQVRFEEVTARSGERVIAKAAGWYVFPGSTRWFVLPVAPQECPVPRSLEIRATADGKSVHKDVELPGSVCAP